MTFSPVEPFTWEDSAGRTWEAILAYPFDYREGQRYPLIVQTHGFARGAFFAEGVPTTTAFPGRAATARGFMVLTIDENREAAKSDVITHEAANVLDGYQSVIAKLDRQGLIDRARVGIIGWSRTSYHVKYAITKAPDLFAAAVGADGIDFGYGNYLAGVDLPYLDGPRVWDQLYRGAPYGQWAEWSEAAPAFNVNRVKTPFRGEANSGRESLLSEWEFYAGLRRLNTPTELWVYPRGHTRCGDQRNDAPPKRGASTGSTTG